VSERWQIELVRSGGLAGVKRRWHVSSQEVGGGEAAELERLLAALEDVPAQPAGPARGADRFQYDLRVTRGGQTRTVTVREGAIPAEIKPLIDRLTSRPSS
jgi:hypothetical protein